MYKNLHLKKQQLDLFFLFIIISSFCFGQTGWAVDPTFNKRIVKTRDFFFRVAKRTDGSFVFAKDTDKTKLGLLNTDGTVSSTFSVTTNGNILAITQAQNNKMYVGGDFTSAMNIFAPKIIRLNNDGTRDVNFLPDSNTQNVYALHELSDGKLLVGRDGSIQRLNTDGTIDTSFSTVTTNGLVQSFAILSNGKILAGGAFTTINGSAKNRIVLLNSDGTIDNSFALGTGFNSDVNVVRVSPDGNFYIGGKFTTYKGTTVNRIAKVSSTGTLDSTFHTSNTGFNNDVWTIEFMNDGKPLMGGLFTTYKGVANNSIIKLNSDGTLDSTFDTGTADSNGIVYKIIINSPNDVFVSGTFLKYKNTYTNQSFLANNDGSINSSFHFDERFCMPGISNWKLSPTSYTRVFNYPTAIQTDGKIILANVYFENIFYVLIRLNADGTKDNTFNFNTSTLPTNFTVWDVNKIIIRPDGKIICSALAGRQYAYDGGKYYKGLFQLNADGSFDNSFNTGYIYANNNPDAYGFDTALSIALQNDGKLIVHSNRPFNYRGFQANAGAIRILQNGNIDISFQNIEGSFSNNTGFIPAEILCLPNNQIILYTTDYAQSGYGGYIQNPNNFGLYNTYFIVKLNSDGTLANRFENLFIWNKRNYWNENKPSEILNKIILDGNSLIITGKFNRVNGNIQNSIARIDFDGNFINNLSSPITDNDSFENTQVTDIVKYNNKYYFTTYSNLTPTNLPFYDETIDCDINLSRANIDGSLDSTFPMLTLDRYSHVINSNAYSNNYPNSIYSPRNVYFGFNETNKLVVFGHYNSINSEPYIGLSRIIINNTALSTQDTKEKKSIFLYPNPTSDFINLESKEGVINIAQVFDMQGKLVKTVTPNSDKVQFSIQELPNGTYLVKVQTNKNSQTMKVIKK